jgi:hypothetical protein
LGRIGDQGPGEGERGPQRRVNPNEWARGGGGALNPKRTMGAMVTSGLGQHIKIICMTWVPCVCHIKRSNCEHFHNRLIL